MSPRHCLRCDCLDCLPGVPATATRVYQDAAPPPAGTSPERRAQLRAAAARYRQRNPERARQACQDWNRKRPAERAAHNAKSNRAASLANFAERAAARMGAE